MKLRTKDLKFALFLITTDFRIVKIKDGEIIMEESLYIVMPAYNEEDNIEDTVKNWYKLLGG